MINYWFTIMYMISNNPTGTRKKTSQTLVVLPPKEGKLGGGGGDLLVWPVVLQSWGELQAGGRDQPRPGRHGAPTHRQAALHLSS
jgi:hypothetical protein